MRSNAKVRSVRFVLTLWYTLVLLAAFCIFCAGVYLYLRHLQEAELEQNLFEEVDWIARLVDVERAQRGYLSPLDSISNDVARRIFAHFTMNPRNYIVMLTSVRGNILYESDNRGTVRLLSGISATTVTIQTFRDPVSGPMRVAARRDDPFIIEVAYPEASVQAVLGQLLRIFGLLVPVVLFVSISGGWFMAGLVLRPIRDISRRANTITAQNLNERIPPRPVNDELSELITTFNRMISRLQESFSQMKEFLLNVAHELKTPLTILKGESELALGKPLTSEEAQQLTTTYLEETIRMARIVDDLLTLARADAGQVQLRQEPVQLDALLQELYEDAVILSAGKPLTVTLAHNEPAVVTGDPEKLRQMFRALVSNAVRYTDAGGSLTIRSSTTPTTVSVDFEDTGVGIPPESLGRIFDRFYRVDAARARATGGSGLGLSIARWIAEAHHGTIGVRSTPGKGSCFTVTIPCRI